MLFVTTLPFVPPDGSPDATPETSKYMDICCTEGAQGKAATGEGQRGDSVPGRHHDSSRAHCPRGQKSVLGVRYRRL